MAPRAARRWVPDLVRGFTEPTATLAERWAYIGLAAVLLIGSSLVPALAPYHVFNRP